MISSTINQSITDFSSGCKYLEDLNISWCQNVTDKGIQLVAENCLYLKTLVCKGCEGITSGCFSNLNENSFAQLHSLNLLSCIVSLAASEVSIKKHIPIFPEYY